MPISVGSFTKTTNTTTPVDQVVAHGLGETPKAMIFFTTKAAPNATWSNYAFPLFGMVDQNMDGICISGDYTHGQDTTDITSNMALKAISYINESQTIFAECTVSAWDSTNFTLNWTTNTTTDAPIIGFIAIGGSAVQSKVIEHALDGDTGADPIVGAGFIPTLAIMLNIGSVTGALPEVRDSGLFGLGIATATEQWGIAIEATNGVGTSDSRRAQRTDNCLLALDTASDAFSWLGAFSSFDADGMTLNIATAGTANSRLGVLFLRGISADLGAFNKTDNTSVPVDQDITGLDKTPLAVLLAGVNMTTATTVQASALLSLGASDGTNERSGSMRDEDNQIASDAGGIMKTTKALMEVSETAHNDTTTTVNAEADLAIGNKQFTLTWTTNVATTNEYLYAALSMTTGGGGGGGGGSGGKGGGGGQGGGGGGGGGGPPGGGPPGQTRRTIVGQQRRRRRGLVGLF